MQYMAGGIEKVGVCLRYFGENGEREKNAMN